MVPCYSFTNFEEDTHFINFPGGRVDDGADKWSVVDRRLGDGILVADDCLCGEFTSFRLMMRCALSVLGSYGVALILMSAAW